MDCIYNLQEKKRKSETDEARPIFIQCGEFRSFTCLFILCIFNNTYTTMQMNKEMRIIEKLTRFINHFETITATSGSPKNFQFSLKFHMKCQNAVFAIKLKKKTKHEYRFSGDI